MLYLEDLYVQPKHRKKGIASLLLMMLSCAALAGDCARMVWQVLDWNESAIDFYKSINGNVRPVSDRGHHLYQPYLQIEREWLTVRMYRKEVRSLANGDVF